MPQQHGLEGTTRRGAFAAAIEETAEPDDGPTAFDVVRVQNYDHRRRHDVVIVVDTPDGTQVLTDRLSLPPGGSDRTRAVLPPDEYDLRVEVDGVERTRRTCRLSRSPSETAVIELGNGAVSVISGASDRSSTA